MIVSVAVTDPVVHCPAIVAVCVFPTPTVVIVKLAEVAPAGTVTVAGTVAFELLDFIVNTRPPEGAGC